MKHTNMTSTHGIVIAAILGLGLFTQQAHAETDFMTSWQTKTYVPDWYIGKELPTYQSFIDVGFELIEDGKPADLSKTVVRWYVDDQLFRNETNGLGIKRFTVYNQKYGGDVTDIKISLPNFKGKVLEKIINIPVRDPEVVIDVPFFQKKIPKGENDVFAWPFFFNTLNPNALGLQWRTGGGVFKPGKMGESMSVSVGRDIETGTKYEIGATIGNLRKTAESATKSVLVETL